MSIANQSNFAENILKGRMAETLFEELMKKSGNIVYRFGYEAIVQNLTQLEESFDRYSEVGERIRAIPDFIVVDKRWKPEFVEAKFRWDGKLSAKDYSRFEKIQSFWNAKIIIINCWEQPYFRVSEPPYFDKSKGLISEPLLSVAEWNI